MHVANAYSAEFLCDGSYLLRSNRSRSVRLQPCLQQVPGRKYSRNICFDMSFHTSRNLTTEFLDLRHAKLQKVFLARRGGASWNNSTTVTPKVMTFVPVDFCKRICMKINYNAWPPGPCFPSCTMQCVWIVMYWINLSCGSALTHSKAISHCWCHWYLHRCHNIMWCWILNPMYTHSPWEPWFMS